MTTPRVKVCGLVRRPDAELVAASGAHYGGVILAPGGRRSISAGAAAALFADLPIRRVGVFVDADPAELRCAAEIAALEVIQLHGLETPAQATDLREEGRWEVWKAVRPRSAEEFLSALDRYGDAVDGILLDGWSAAAAGGTGSRFPWEAVADYRDRVPAGLRLIIAGGLAPANVAAAIALLRPSVVDVSSGVETAPGMKDPVAVPAFISAVREAAMDTFPHS
jgi:phosphoribosylanthranilate isomerase